jgi:hypothetical protein
MHPRLSDADLAAADALLADDHLMRLALIGRERHVVCAGIDPREEELFIDLERFGLVDVSTLGTPPRRIAWRANRNGRRVLYLRGLAP